MSRAEKYIEDYTHDCSNQIINGNYGTIIPHFTPWLTPDQARSAVEIAKEEVIEKACEYLDGLIELLNDHGYELKKERIIDGLKQAMKDE